MRANPATIHAQRAARLARRDAARHGSDNCPNCYAPARQQEHDVELDQYACRACGCYWWRTYGRDPNALADD